MDFGHFGLRRTPRPTEVRHHRWQRCELGIGAPAGGLTLIFHPACHARQVRDPRPDAPNWFASDELIDLRGNVESTRRPGVYRSPKPALRVQPLKWGSGLVAEAVLRYGCGTGERAGRRRRGAQRACRLPGPLHVRHYSVSIPNQHYVTNSRNYY